MNLKYYLLSDVAKIAGLRSSIMTTLTNVSEYCICDYINELKMRDEDVLELDLGIGTLSIEVVEDEIKYQFKPSVRLEKNIINTVLDGENPLVKASELNLEKRIYNTYKGLL